MRRVRPEKWRGRTLEPRNGEVRQGRLIKGLGLLSLAAVACSACGGGSAHSAAKSKVTSTTPKAVVRFSSSAASGLANEVTSSNAAVRKAALIPELAAQVGTQALLPPGTTLTIHASTFTAVGPTVATVAATTTGSVAGQWKLYIVKQGSRWKLLDAEKSS